MLVVVDGTTVVPTGINSVQKLDGGGGDGGGSSMGIIIGAAAGGALVLFIVIGSIFYTLRQRLGSRSGSLLTGTKGMRGDDIMGKEWSTVQTGTGSPDELTCASPFSGLLSQKRERMM